VVSTKLERPDRRKMFEGNGAAASLLIVDDSSTFRTAFRSCLLDQGSCEVAEASSGEAAVKMCRELSPRIVFMDVRMPGIGGLEACRQIRAASADTRLVLLSASLRDAPQDLTTSGAARIMTKDELLVPGRIRTLVQELVG
jgi:two-component system, NarL family, invasion response regulator UvrY